MTHGRDARGSAPIGTPGGGGSPTRQFAWLSLLTIGASTLVFGLVLAHFAERGILDREWASTASLARTAVRFSLRPEDFAPDPASPAAATADAADRFEELTRQIRMLPEVQSIVAYDARGRVLWTDAERQGPIPPSEAELRRALGGKTSVRLAPGDGDGGERVELYAPVTFPGEGRIAGVLRTHVDPSRVLATVRQARLTLWTLALASGAVLYAALYGIVWRASRTLRAQHAALAQRADELTRSNVALREAQEQLVTAERFAAFGEISAAVAHGIANPLAAIRATAQLARLDADGPVRERLAQMIADTDRLTERMRTLLRFGRPVEQRRVPTALEVAIPHALESVNGRATSQGVRLELAVPAELPKVRLDPARFEEALLCLAGNALDAMSAGGRLRVAAALVDTGAKAAIEVVVEDTGPGIPPQIRARVFEPFFTTKPDGTGLGLAVARKLLENAGGRLRLESPEGRGARAVITLLVEEG